MSCMSQIVLNQFRGTLQHQSIVIAGINGVRAAAKVPVLSQYLLPCASNKEPTNSSYSRGDISLIMDAVVKRK